MVFLWKNEVVLEGISRKIEHLSKKIKRLRGKMNNVFLKNKTFLLEL